MLEILCGGNRLLVPEAASILDPRATLPPARPCSFLEKDTGDKTGQNADQGFVSVLHHLPDPRERTICNHFS